MQGSPATSSPARRAVLTFVFGLPLALVLLAVVYLGGTLFALIVLIPVLVVLIYVLPGHGEPLPPGGVR